MCNLASRSERSKLLRGKLKKSGATLAGKLRRGGCRMASSGSSPRRPAGAAMGLLCPRPAWHRMAPRQRPPPSGSLSCPARSPPGRLQGGSGRRRNRRRNNCKPGRARAQGAQPRRCRPCGSTSRSRQLHFPTAWSLRRMTRTVLITQVASLSQSLDPFPD